MIAISNPAHAASLFVIAGAFDGVVQPVLRTRGAVYAALAVAGAIVMNVIAIADSGWGGVEGFDVMAITILGAFLGLIA